jgi:hypothetical protein
VTVSGGSISETQKRVQLVGKKTPLVGDGIQVLRLPAEGSAAAVSSSVTIEGVKLESNGRLGVLVDASKVSLDGATISGGEAAIVVQNAKVGDQTLGNNVDDQGTVLSPTTPSTPYLTNPKALYGCLPIPIP